MAWLNEYERRARLVPGLLALLPAVIAGLALGLREIPVVTTIISTLLTFGGPVVLASVVRDRGAAIEPSLESKWGGRPTTVALRARGADATGMRRRQLIEQVTGVTLPDGAAEAADPVAADGLYETAVSEVRQRTHDTRRFNLLFEENKNYGFLRNLLAMRPFGLWACAVGACVLVAELTFDVASARPSDTFFGLAFIGACSVFWIFFPREGRVFRVAQRYSNQLFAAVADLAAKG